MSKDKKTIASRLRRLRRTITPDYAYFNILAMLTGIACGLIAVGFRYLIFGFDDLFFIKGHPSDEPIFYIVVIGVPALGGLVAGLLIHRLAREAKGHGVPEIMESVAVHDGRIRGRVVAVKALASSITIGSGGSAGREVPIAQMGGTVGSNIAQKLKLTPYQTKVLLAAGVAGGISATFNTPIAGVIFALELIIAEFKARSFIPIVISSVFATLMSRAILLYYIGEDVAFVFGELEYTLKTPWELGFYLILGLLAGIVAITFIRSLYSLEDFFDGIKIPPYIKPAIGGLFVGTIGLVLLLNVGEYHVFGVGYGSIQSVLDGDFTYEWWAIFILLFALIFFKIIATSFTIGSGGSGGVFAPSLFIGAMTGGAFGVLVHHFFPHITANYPAYAIVGMAAVFAGGSRATLTAIIIIFEMTGDYDIILPLMFSCVVSDAVGTFWFKETIYTMKLKRKGIRVEHGMDVNVMDTITIKEAMTKSVETVQEDMTVEQLQKIIQDTGHMGFPVMDKRYKLCGIVTHDDVRRAIKECRVHHTVRDIETTEVIKVHPDDTLNEALMKIGQKEISHFPVVDNKDDTKLIGFVTKDDIINAYKRKKLESTYMEYYEKKD